MSKVSFLLRYKGRQFVFVFTTTAKILFDKLFAFLFFAIIGWWLFPIIAILVKLDSKGPVYYKQERWGVNNQPIICYKFRTMQVNKSEDDFEQTTRNDPRVTSLGKILRKFSLDELPQFINVLKGDMAIIGPRPERPVFVEQIAASIPLYQTRHVIKPGLTGWAQVNYPYGTNLEDSLMKLRYDLYYIKHRSLFLDVNIVVKTMSTVLFFRGQ